MARTLKILASTWHDGLVAIDDKGPSRELPNRCVRGLSHDLEGGVLAVVDGHSLFRRTNDGDWNILAQSDHVLSVTCAMNGQIWVGTDDARVLQLNDHGALKQIDCFDSIEGRDTWFAGTAVVDGKEVGPPLGVRSLCGTVHGTLFANVHVGGVPRSIDGGASWVPTIEVDLDVHQVCASLNHKNVVAVATAFGLGLSHDNGEKWSIHTDGLHAQYCSAVEIVGDTVFVAASETHFSKEGAVYRRNIETSSEPMEKIGDGLPVWLDGIVDTSCIASRDENMVIISAGGGVYVSEDRGLNWRAKEETVAGASSVLIVS